MKPEIKRTLLVLCAMLTACTFFVSCGKSAQKSQDKKLVVGFSLDSLVVERWKRDLEVFEK